MRVHILTASLVLTTAIISMANLAAPPAWAHNAKVTCLCDCPDDHKVKASHAAPPAAHRMARRPVRRAYAAYDYGDAAPVGQGGWHGAWRAAPNDGYVPDIGPMAGPAYDAPPAYYEPSGLRIDDRGWSGGVGNGGEGGGGGGGFGQVILANGGSAENGPSYNSYGQSFQSNPSVAGPFQSRLMGGLAPPPSSK